MSLDKIFRHHSFEKGIAGVLSYAKEGIRFRCPKAPDGAYERTPAHITAIRRFSKNRQKEEGRIDGAFLAGKTWNIRENAVKPERKNANAKAPETLLEILADEKKSGRKGGIYHKIQVEMTDNSNHIEGSRLTHDQTRYIYETNTIGFENEALNIDDIIDFHYEFERIHPFQDGNGRVGRLIMFKECLKNDIVPFILGRT